MSAAWLSLGELLKKGIELREDIEPSELAVKATFEAGQWVIYLSDTLDNGAGYSSKYSDPVEFEKLCAYIDGRLLTEFKKENHLDCLTSCHLCLRNYQNRLQHYRLSWRLAAELFTSIFSEELSPLSAPLWDPVVKTYMPILMGSLLQKKLLVEQHEGYCFYRYVHDEELQFGILPWHPFEFGRKEMRSFENKLRKQLKLAQVFSVCPNDFNGSPMTVSQQISEKLRGNIKTAKQNPDGI